MFDCTKHVCSSIKKTFKPKEVFTQHTANKVDPMFIGELKGMLVAAHSTVTVYKDTKVNNKALSFDLCMMHNPVVPTS